MPINISTMLDVNKIAEKQLKIHKLKINNKTSAFLQLENFNNRHISKRTRKIRLSSNLMVPPEVNEGFKKLLHKISSGDDINPYLSKNLNNPSFKDSFLDYFGLHHLHLGCKLDNDKKIKGFIERTRYVAIAKILNNEIFIISIENHDKKENRNIWSNSKYIEILHNEFPEAIKKYKLNGFFDYSVNINNDDIEKLLKAKVNIPIVTSDGTTYMILGGGVASSGDNINAVTEMIKINNNIILAYFQIYKIIIKLIPSHLYNKIHLSIESIIKTFYIFKAIYNEFDSIVIIYNINTGTVKSINFKNSNIDIKSTHLISHSIIILNITLKNIIHYDILFTMHPSINSSAIYPIDANQKNFLNMQSLFSKFNKLYLPTQIERIMF